MAGDSNSKKTGVRILFGVVIGMLALSMLLYLVPQGPSSAETSTDVVARVGDQNVTLSDVHDKLNEIRKSNNIPKQLEALYARQILNQLVLQKEVEYEAKRLGITVSEKNALTASACTYQAPSTAIPSWAWMPTPMKSASVFS